MKKNFSVLFLVLIMSICGCQNKEKEEETTPIDESQISFEDGINSKNKDGYYKILDDLYVNFLPGIYDDSINLKFEVKSQSGVLTYKLNEGKETQEFKIYNNEIKLERLSTRDLLDFPLTTSVDADTTDWPIQQVISEDYVKNIQQGGNYYLKDKQNRIEINYIDENKGVSFNKTLTYFIDPDIDLKSIPVISLNMDYVDYFDDENGFYNLVWKELEKRINLEYFDYSKSEYFIRNSKVKISGNYSRGYPQRSLNLNFKKDENGNKNKKVTADIFNGAVTEGDRDKKLTKLTRIRLHSGGNTFEKFTCLNDAITCEIAEGTNASTTSYRPCIVYLNGEYWGLYSIREHLSDVYYEDNYDVDTDDIVTGKLFSDYQVDDGDETLFNGYIKELKSFIKKDFSKDEVYDEFCEKYFDMPSFLDTLIIKLYGSDLDYIGNLNNLRMWRTTTIDESKPYYDGKWRFSLHDSDYCFIGDTNDYLDPETKYTYRNYPVLKALLKSEKFKSQFLTRAEELLETYLDKDRCLKIVDEMIEEVRPYRQDAFKRWGKNDLYMLTWNKNILNCKKFIAYQYANWLDKVKISINK